VVFDDVYIRVAPTNPQKRSTQSTLIITPIFLKKKHPLFFVCLHLKLLKMFLSMALKLPSQDQKA
jgi:hypothetical protein